MKTKHSKTKTRTTAGRTASLRSGTFVRRWRRTRPHCGGMWQWREYGRGGIETMLLTPCGKEVASVDDAEEGTPQYYWEQTETTQRMMPGLWRQLPPNTELCNAGPAGSASPKRPSPGVAHE